MTDKTIPSGPTPQLGEAEKELNNVTAAVANNDAGVMTGVKNYGIDEKEKP